MKQWWNNFLCTLSDFFDLNVWTLPPVPSLLEYEQNCNYPCFNKINYNIVYHIITLQEINLLYTFHDNLKNKQKSNTRFKLQMGPQLEVNITTLPTWWQELHQWYIEGHLPHWQNYAGSPTESYVSSCFDAEAN